MAIAISKFLGVPDHVSSYFSSTPYPLLYCELCDMPFSSEPQRGSVIVFVVQYMVPAPGKTYKEASVD